MIVKSVLLPLAQRDAFDLFTQRAGAWWPPSRRHTNDPASDIILHQAGRFFERTHDGQEIELGAINVWEPPSRIALDFFPATGPEHPTSVEITFVAHPDGGTLVTVRHQPTPASATLWTSRAPRYEQSWDSVLASLLEAAGLATP
jgi:hypothetical protein